MSQGVFLTFEGPDGGGKTTQITRLAERLTAQGYTVTRTREPGGDRVGEKVRDLLLHGDVSPEAELLLFAAARAQNVEAVVRPALGAGYVVLCDRFTDSTVAYQGYGRGLPLDLIARLNAFATRGLMPHKTFLLDLPPATGLSRQRASEQDRWTGRRSISMNVSRWLPEHGESGPRPDRGSGCLEASPGDRGPSLGDSRTAASTFDNGAMTLRRLPSGPTTLVLGLLLLLVLVLAASLGAGPSRTPPP
jgi:dTMP kinase